jgi:hypothetical protein
MPELRRVAGARLLSVSVSATSGLGATYLREAREAIEEDVDRHTTCLACTYCLTCGECTCDEDDEPAYDSDEDDGGECTCDMCHDAEDWQQGDDDDPDPLMEGQ